MTPSGAAYPAEPVTFISAAPPGGGWHQLCVKAAAALRDERLVRVPIEIVINPGGLQVFEEVVAARRGDAHTLVAFSPGLTAQILLKGSRCSYADITPIAGLSTDYGALIVPADSSIATLDQLAAALRRPDPPAIQGGQAAGAMHEAMARVVGSAVGVPGGAVRYLPATGIATGIASLLAGAAPVAAVGAADAAEAVRAGRVRMLAVLAEQRIPEPFEAVPTAAEQGGARRVPDVAGVFRASRHAGAGGPLLGGRLHPPVGDPNVA